MWFCAHAIFYFKLTDSEQESFLVHENVYLVYANDDSSARTIAKKIAKEHEDTSEDGHLELNGKKVACLFAGVRKLIEVETHPGSDQVNELSGLEVTYSVYEVDTLDEVFKLARGEMVNVLYRE
jgi:hypothetical protein